MASQLVPEWKPASAVITCPAVMPGYLLVGLTAVLFISRHAGRKMGGGEDCTYASSFFPDMTGIYCSHLFKMYYCTYSKFELKNTQQ